MLLSYAKLLEYVEDGYIHKQEEIINGNTYHLFCYTKKTFYEYHWDDNTIYARGVIFNVTSPLNIYQVNTPLPKIFNVGEAEVSEEGVNKALQSDDLELIYKVNGHLTLVSYDKPTETMIVHTKGSLSSEMIQEDIKVMKDSGLYYRLEEYLKESVHEITTLMFEAIVPHDKHYLFEEQREEYFKGQRGGFILIGLRAIERYWTGSYGHTYLREEAKALDVPLVKRFLGLKENFKELKEFRGIEGFIVHSHKLGICVKIKTSDYLKHKYMQELTPEHFYKMFLKSKSEEELHSYFDEELHPLVGALAQDYGDFYIDNFESGEIKEGWFYLTKKEVALDKNIPNFIKPTIFDFIDGKACPSRFLTYRGLKEEFISRISKNKLNKSCFEASLAEFKGRLC